MSAAPDPVNVTVEEFLERSRSDRAFYFRNALKIRPKHARYLEPFVMRPAQERLMALIDDCRARGVPPRIIILKARQLGFSTVADMELFRQCHLWPHQQALIAAHKAESAEYLFQNIHRAYNNLPEAVKPDKKYSQKRLIHFEENDSRLEVQVAEDARGFTAQILHLSELAFMKDAKALITAVMQTVPQTPESLVIIESTANGVGNEFHNIWTAAKSGRNEWIPLFVPWFDEPLYTRDAEFSEEEFAEHPGQAWERARLLRATHNLTLEQAAWWLYTLENNCLGDMDVMEQEYASNSRDCFLASGRKVFDTEGLQHFITQAGLSDDDEVSPDEARRREYLDERNFEIDANPADRHAPVLTQQRGGRLRVYRRPEHHHKYIVSCDPSAGDPGSDPSPIIVLNRHTLNLDAVWYGRTPPELLRFHAAALGWWYNDAKVVWEANNHGILFGQLIINDSKYPNVYWRRTSHESTSGRETDKPGFWTSGGNREHVIDFVRMYVRQQAGVVQDERMVREWMSLHYVKLLGGGERVDHPEGGFIDLTMAFGIALAVHAGSFDATLAPLSVDEFEAAAAAAQVIRSLKLMGLSTEDVDTFGIPHAELDRIEFEHDERERRRSLSGLGGMM